MCMEPWVPRSPCLKVVWGHRERRCRRRRRKLQSMPSRIDARSTSEEGPQGDGTRGMEVCSATNCGLLTNTLQPAMPSAPLDFFSSLPAHLSSPIPAPSPSLPILVCQPQLVLSHPFTPLHLLAVPPLPPLPPPLRVSQCSSLAFVCPRDSNPCCRSTCR